MSMMDFFAALRAHANAGDKPIQMTFGELTAYDPTTHAGKFDLVLYPDSRDTSGMTPMETGWVQIATPYNGPAYGAQFPPPDRAQALVFFVDGAGVLPVGALFLFNDIEQAPFPDGKTAGWKDKKGSALKTTEDGPTPGDGAGGAHVIGNKYTSQGTGGGHLLTQDDIAKQVKMATSGGHYDLYDDVGRVIKRVTAGGLQTIHDDAATEIAHVAGHVGLGDRVANLDATHAALNQSHLTQFQSDLKSKRLDDLTKFAAAMVAAGVPNAGAVMGLLAALIDVPVPSGSSVVKVK